MWSPNTLWFEVAVISAIFAIGNILMGHFEEQTPKLRRLGKYILVLIIVTTVSSFFGRFFAFACLLGIFVPMFLYVHLYYLPRRKGINGITGEPKRKYYEYRGWNTNIFDKD
ncbi:hypothetical protein DYBT9623_01486 [Dyadobacter sp. CECT 9623]|uniref:Uncharacterized protein n=1 Tax=Dyadobacter linearis TaxID=2823330 RepID=A0ABN7R5P6_9BACT|nr:hypothetical protein DYBT9623_01486 [Dyadobacter sp. CECT 9623]